MLKYRRVIIKISGESLDGAKDGILSANRLREYANVIGKLYGMGVQIGIVVGAGNIWRGKTASIMGMERATGDYMGMLATVINAIALQSVIEDLDIPTRVMTSLPISAVAEPYIRRKAIHHLENKRVVIFGGGTGNPFFSTDTTAALRASELEADVILMSKNGADGVYSSDPRLNPDAILYKRITYMDVLANQLQIMDSTAVTLCMESDIELRVFNALDAENLIRICNGEDIGTTIRKEFK